MINYQSVKRIKSGEVKYHLKSVNSLLALRPEFSSGVSNLIERASQNNRTLGI